MPQAICELTPRRHQPQPDRQPRQAALRQPRSAAGDGAEPRPQGVHRHHHRGHRATSAASCSRRPTGYGACRRRCCKELPGYDPDVQKNRAQARQIMEKLGYGPDNRLKIKVTTRDLPYFRDPAVILIDQLKEVYIDGELETIDTTNWFPKIMRKDYTVGLNLAGQRARPRPDPLPALRLRRRA